MSNVESHASALLREIRQDIKALLERFDHIDHRFDKLDKKLENIPQAAFGESVLGRYAAAEVEERLDFIEKRLEKLEHAPL